MTHADAGWQPRILGGPSLSAARVPAADPGRAHGPVTGPYPAARATAPGYLPVDQGPTPLRPGMSAEETQLPDLPLYERLTSDGIAAADARGSAVDHVTARRLAICLAARPQSPGFAQHLVRFVRTGAVSHARSATYADRPKPPG